MRALNVVIVGSLWIVVIVLIVLGLVRMACAQDEKTALALAQCLAAECDRCDRGEEKAAIAWVLRKGMERYNANPRNKRKRSFYDQIIAYCAVFDRRSSHYYGKRAKQIRNSTRDKSNHLRDREWKALYEFSFSFVRRPSAVEDPHPQSGHFGGVLDITRAREKGLRILGKYCNKKGKWCTYIFGR